MNNSLIILGNGTSLSNIDLTSLSEYDTFGLNNAYIRFEELDWFPTYYGVFQLIGSKFNIPTLTSFITTHVSKMKKCFYYGKDLVMPVGFLETNREKIQHVNLLYSDNLKLSYSGNKFTRPIEFDIFSILESMKDDKEKLAFEVFLSFSTEQELKYLTTLTKTGILRMFKKESLDRTCYINKPRFNQMWTIPYSFDDFNFYGGNSGIIACSVGYLLGYKKIILVGVDANFTVQNDILEPKGSYWFENYFPTVYNIKEYCSDCTQESLRAQHQDSWELWRDTIVANDLDLDVVNCTPNSRITCFRTSTLEEEL